MNKAMKKFIGWLITIVILVIAFVVWAVGTYSEKTIENNDSTPQNVETMVSQMMNQTATAEQIAILSATPTFTATFTQVPTFTPLPTYTPFPTYTPYPTDTPVPVVAAPQNQTYSNNTGIRGSVAQDISNSAACNIKGNVNSDGEYIYHCPNSPSYSRTKVNLSEGDRWFCSPEEAEAAGFHPAKNMSGCRQ